LNIKLKIQTYFEIVIIIFIFASLFFEHDFGFMGFVNLLFIRPVLIIFLLSSIAMRSIRFIKQETKLFKQSIRQFIYIILLLSSLLFALAFQKEIAFEREIIYFSLNRENFAQVVSLSSQVLQCPKPSEFGCRETVSLPNQSWASEKHITAITYQETVVLLIPNRTYVHFLYIEGQRGIPQLSLGNFKISCDYRLTDDWFIC
jgi:hypothetical protein